MNIQVAVLVVRSILYSTVYSEEKKMHLVGVEKKMLLANELLTSVFSNRSLLNAHEVVVIQ